MSDIHKPIWDCDGAERVADELSRTAGRLHEMADAAEAGRNDVRIDPSGFHALAYYMESWSLSIDRTCEMTECSIDHDSCSWGMRCSRCGTEFEHEKPAYGWRYCPICGSRVVRAND